MLSSERERELADGADYHNRERESKRQERGRERESIEREREIDSTDATINHNRGGEREAPMQQ
jgi:hypothetical protein